SLRALEGNRPGGRRSAEQGQAGDHGDDREGDGEEGATFAPSTDAAADRDEQAEGEGEEQRSGEHRRPSRVGRTASPKESASVGRTLSATESHAAWSNETGRRLQPQLVRT